MGTEDEASRYHKWYEKNKAKVQQRRRERYRKDPTYRSSQVRRVRQRYWDKKPQLVLKRLRRKVTPSYVLAQSKQPGYGLRDTAKLFGRSTRTILFWIKEGVIPAPIYPALNRRTVKVYTEGEFLLLRKHGILLSYPKKTLAQSVFARTVAREIALLRRGYFTEADIETRPQPQRPELQSTGSRRHGSLVHRHATRRDDAVSRPRRPARTRKRRLEVL